MKKFENKLYIPIIFLFILSIGLVITGICLPRMPEFATAGFITLCLTITLFLIDVAKHRKDDF